MFAAPCPELFAFSALVCALPTRRSVGRSRPSVVVITGSLPSCWQSSHRHGRLGFARVSGPMNRPNLKYIIKDVGGVAQPSAFSGGIHFGCSGASLGQSHSCMWVSKAARLPTRIRCYSAGAMRERERERDAVTEFRNGCGSEPQTFILFTSPQMSGRL